ncbi:hypothetical protein A5740_26230 [Mycobacterium sp. GA-1841]|uniref:EspA/EspE family type VII secretion system effector n=1 Tax=Mycobacterium sp. GA-1841 TaxID=1834154 RepID=UPI00096F375B|nr:EspA/EspE family type VII secretion system effector [Mycobacterium sp. GA-1841]OMC39916.1 hypothetical protein A5740_26230 [Mycobacterium sp. GA-1841]
MSGAEDDGGANGPKGPSKLGIATTAFSTYSDFKKLMEGDPIGAVGLLGDAGKWAQLLIPEAIATPVIQYGLYVLTGISKSMGMGSPDGGGAFSDGAKQFQTHGKALEGAYPTETWSGSASNAYTAQNSHQIQRASTMLEADNDIVRILSTQAGQVNHARTEVDWASKGLAAMIPVAMALEATVLGAPESMALQFSAVAVASAVAGAAAANLVNYSQDNAAQIREATEKYRQAGAVGPSGSGAPVSRSGSGDQNGSDSQGDRSGQDTPGTPSAPTSTPSSGNQSGGGGSGAGGGSGSGAGGGSGAGSGGSGSSGGRGSATSIPSTTGMPTGAASSGGGMGGLPSLPQMGGGSGGGGTGMLGGFMGAAGQIVETVTQAVQQAEQQDSDAQNDGESGVATGDHSQAGRAPVNASFGADTTNHAAPQRLTTDR